MKTRCYLLSAIALLLAACSSNDVIKEIKDLEFREQLISRFDANNDHQLTKDEVQLITKIVVHYGVKSVEGIEYMKNLEEYEENGGEIVSLDLSKNSKLQKIDCMNMKKLSRLKVPQNIDTIIMTRTALRELKLEKTPFLSTLFCTEGKLEKLEVQTCPCVTMLNCEKNSLTEIDLSKFPALYKLYCGKNNLTTLDLSNNPNLELVRCKGNQNLKEIICKKGQRIKGITHNPDYGWCIDKGVNVKYID